MGYLVTAHILKEKADFTRLRQLPPSIGTRVYFHAKAKLYLVDAFRPAKPPAYPFQTVLPAADVSLHLPPPLRNLETIYGFLARAKLANGFKKSYINFCCLLSNLLNIPVFSFIADDDEQDFACSAFTGALRRLKCHCGDVVIFFDGENTQVIPWAPPEECEGNVTDLGPLQKAAPEVQVLPRTTPWDSQLHAIAMAEIQEFSGLKDPILGLGSFDPPDDESDWQLLS